MANLLLIDDDVGTTEVLAELLKLEGHSVRVAHDGEQGLALLFDEHPDLILCDVDMPVLDGPGVARRVAADDADTEKIPFLLFSGVADLRRLAGELGTPYYLAKPSTLNRLLAIVARALAERTPLRPQPPSTVFARAGSGSGINAQ
jgi:CheY-like chemotaxis protein